MSAPSPTQRTLAHCRKLGWLAGVVEKWNPHARIRQDLFGFVDLVAVDDQPGVLCIQATSGAGVSARVRKIQDTPELAERLARLKGAGNRVEVWGWRKAGARGKRKTWQVRRVEL